MRSVIASCHRLQRVCVLNEGFQGSFDILRLIQSQVLDGFFGGLTCAVAESILRWKSKKKKRSSIPRTDGLTLEESWQSCATFELPATESKANTEFLAGPRPLAQAVTDHV